MTDKEAIERLEYIKTHDTDPEDYEVFDLAIKALEEYRPQGKWIHIYPLPEDIDGSYMCSVCQIGDFDIQGNENFCPHCGADMRFTEG